MFTLTGRSVAGARKSVNQDAWCALAAKTSVGEVALAVVCDGVGGLSSGELASSTVASEFSLWFEEGLASLMADPVARGGSLDLADVAAAWERMLQALNRRIGDYGRARGVRLGTTFSGILVFRGRYLFGHVGDCRIYRVSRGEVTRLTTDQTLAARAIREGTLSEEEALSSPQSSVLLQSVGTQVEVRPVFGYGEARPGDLFLLCCDGFYRLRGDKGVRASFASADPRDEKGLARLIGLAMDAAMEGGERDNLTAVCLGLVDGGAEEEPFSGDELRKTLLLEPEGVETAMAGGFQAGPGDEGDDPTTPIEPEEPGDGEATTTLDDPADDEVTTMLDAEGPSAAAGGEAPWRA